MYTPFYIHLYMCEGIVLPILIETEAMLDDVKAVYLGRDRHTWTYDVIHQNEKEGYVDKVIYKSSCLIKNNHFSHLNIRGDALVIRYTEAGQVSSL